MERLELLQSNAEIFLAHGIFTAGAVLNCLGKLLEAALDERMSPTTGISGIQNKHVSSLLIFNVSHCGGVRKWEEVGVEGGTWRITAA